MGEESQGQPRQQRHIFHINEMLLIVHLTLVKCDLIVSANAKGHGHEKDTRGWGGEGWQWVVATLECPLPGHSDDDDDNGNGSGSWLRYKLAQFLFNRNTQALKYTHWHSLVHIKKGERVFNL